MQGIAKDGLRPAQQVSQRPIAAPHPTPTLALAATQAGCGAIMVTGIHISAKRNGLKFYTRNGEISKTDEEVIRPHLTAVPSPTATLAPCTAISRQASGSQSGICEPSGSQP